MALTDNIDGVAKVERELTDLNNRLAPGTAQVAALQMEHQPVAGPVLGIIEALLEKSYIHSDTSQK